MRGTEGCVRKLWGNGVWLSTMKTTQGETVLFEMLLRVLLAAATVVYENGGPVLLDFDHHPEMVSMPAVGAINKEPHRWNPEVCHPAVDAC